MQFIATNVGKKSIMSTKNLIYVAGPTGVGKTKLSLELAKRFDTEIISCDSRQFYKEMEIGTAVPTAKELKEVKHHFIQHKSIQEVYTVSDFENGTGSLSIGRAFDLMEALGLEVKIDVVVPQHDEKAKNKLLMQIQNMVAEHE